jgi:hypothetical protein
MSKKKILLAFFQTGFIFGLLGWFYIVLNSEFHPYTLPWQLTHFAKWPREDTFGEMCFLVAIISCFCYLLLRGDTPTKKK